MVTKFWNQQRPNPEYQDKIKIIAIDLWDKLEDETYGLKMNYI